MTAVTATLPTLQIGPIALDVPVVLAPMAGITNTAFRRLCQEYGAGLYVSEMITSRALVEPPPESMRLISHPESDKTHARGRPLDEGTAGDHLGDIQARAVL